MIVWLVAYIKTWVKSITMNDNHSIIIILMDSTQVNWIYCKRQKSAGDDRSTLTLKLVGRVIMGKVRNRGYQWTPNGPRSNKNLKKKNRINLNQNCAKSLHLYLHYFYEMYVDQALSNKPGSHFVIY